MINRKDVPKGFDVGETQRKKKAPVHFSAPTSTSTAKKEVVIVKGKGEKLSAIPYGLFQFFLFRT